MGYVYEAAESIATGARRIASEKCDEIRAYLQQADNLDEGIHSARKSFKQLRALLRLVRPALKTKTYELENTTYRDASRHLAPIREKWVMVEVLDQLVERFDEPKITQAAQPIRASLLNSYERVHEYIIKETNTLAQVVEIVTDCQARIPAWQIEPDSVEAALAGIAKIYKQGQVRMTHAYDYAGLPDVDALHEWRKSVKYLWYHLRLLQSTAPTALETSIVDLKQLSDHLGLAHDIAELRQTIATWPMCAQGGGRLLLARMDQEQAHLEQAAQVLGSTIYNEQWDVYEARLRLYWEQWPRDVA